jgi:hypothetical protein
MPEEAKEQPRRTGPPEDKNCLHCQKPVICWCPYCGKSLCNKGGCMDVHDRICEGHRKSREPVKK